VSTLVTTGLIVFMGFNWVLAGNVSQIQFSARSFLPDFSSMDSFVFLAGALVIVSGIEVSAAHASAVKNPKRSFPKAIFFSVFVSLVAIILCALAIAFVVPSPSFRLILTLNT
jgi:amino acid transporter